MIHCSVVGGRLHIHIHLVVKGVFYLIDFSGVHAAIVLLLDLNFNSYAMPFVKLMILTVVELAIMNLLLGRTFMFHTVLHILAGVF